MIILKWSSKILTGSALAAFLYANAATAIELGAITLKSASSEPLIAEIAVTDVNGIDSSNLKVQLASPAAFAQADISREDYLAQLDLSIAVNSANETIIRLTSNKPLDRSSIDILVQMESPLETVSRRYLLSLLETVSSAVNGGARQLNDNEHRVVVGDTLWNVSKRYRPRGLSILQTMDAVYSQNPQAFVNGNANEMKEGAILRLPSKGDISQEAGDIVARQIGLVDEAQSQKPEPELEVTQLEPFAENLPPETDNQIAMDADIPSNAEELVASDNVIGTTEVVAAEQIELVAEQQPSDIEVDQSKIDERLAAIDNEIISTEDDISKTELENNELRERMALLESQVDAPATSASQGDQQQIDTSTIAVTKKFTFVDLQKQLAKQPWYLWSGIAVMVLALVLFSRRSASRPDPEPQGQPNTEPLDDEIYPQESAVDTGADLLVDDQDGLKLNPE
ncbi:MAG: FimV/HubP family polar landmark protein, partial [Porticoccaceae bacterium]|nr:FimV/HubP family polar landmark protein [Porticoccaceae bacterium]